MLTSPLHYETSNVQIYCTLTVCVCVHNILTCDDLIMLSLSSRSKFLKKKKWKTQEGFVIPNLRTAVLEKLQELRDHDVQRTIQHITVQNLSRVLTDLLQGSKRSLGEKTK